jgi:hypothetical protein
MVVEIDGALFVRLDIVTGAVDQARANEAAGFDNYQSTLRALRRQVGLAT